MGSYVRSDAPNQEKSRIEDILAFFSSYFCTGC